MSLAISHSGLRNHEGSSVLQQAIMLRYLAVLALGNAIHTASRTASLRLRGGADDAATHACAAALASAKGKTAPKIARWRLDVDDGRLCPKGWSGEASQVVEDALREFDAATRSHWQFEGRVSTRKALAAYLTSEVGAAHGDQLAGAAERRLRQLRAALGRAYAKSGIADADVFDQELRKAEHAFDGDAARCRVDALLLAGADQRTAFLDAARQLASDFEASPAAQLVATRGERKRAESAAKAAQRAARADASKGKAPSLIPKAVNVAVQLVGMLRPAGLGNMQGYCSYAMGPHSLLFGYADDRDPNGGGMDGGEVPLFRLQPKFTVDVDL